MLFFVFSILFSQDLVVKVLIPFKDAVVVDIDVVVVFVTALVELDFIDLAAVVVILVAVPR